MRRPQRAARPVAAPGADPRAGAHSDLTRDSRRARPGADGAEDGPGAHRRTGTRPRGPARRDAPASLRWSIDMIASVRRIADRAPPADPRRSRTAAGPRMAGPRTSPHAPASSAGSDAPARAAGARRRAIDGALPHLPGDAHQHRAARSRPRRRRSALTISRASVALDVRDNGRGMRDASPARAARRLGLLGMRERAAAFGGHVIDHSAPHTGTHVRIRISLATARSRPAARTQPCWTSSCATTIPSSVRDWRESSRTASTSRRFEKPTAGRALLDMLREQASDVVLLDVDAAGAQRARRASAAQDRSGRACRCWC